MTRAPDRQRARVYAWEDVHVAPHARDLLPFSAAQPMVDAIWAEMGLRYPPAVEPLPRQSRRLLGDANRLRLRLPQQWPSFLLLHELAHAMTSTHDGASDGHGPRFMGLYLQMLERYLRLPAESLLASLAEAGIACDPAARPLFLDP
ncbi:SprT family zinc-dependent metalloprotease [Roseomonas marmotae]|uniref:DUF45 domain-containing protein n=1 Tax=Roseomonas marmotae TaxID=2768161 RepID=A0ABS3KHM8_9PROT|nr:hypothetical protein [Roseomonas marmotae]MBO1075816.1 hypothetical protein [Roseomonas marmotae]QTI81990.1 hypothetical protein IAI58_21920 [Roseomonas marmotae]